MTARSYAQTRWSVVFPGGLLVFALGAAWVTEHAREPAPLPSSQIETPTGWADESSCLECHVQAQTFWETGHAQTLHPAAAEPARHWLAGLSATPEVQAEGTVFATAGNPTRVTSRQGDFAAEAELAWCFGSGRHARTWVATLPDGYGITDLLEFRWTWYRERNGFAITPGHPEQTLPGYYARLGVLFDHAKGRRCFGCHATVVPVTAGAIAETRVHAGVTCQRCHGPRQAHVDSGGVTGDHFWARATRDEAMARCAECHRSAEEQAPGTIRPDNPEIARFQPIGLTQSACYQRSAMSCVTCHDPHRPMDAQDPSGIWQCTQCHDGARPDRPECAADQRDGCLHCHMPKLGMERPLRFTDHWIRIREGAGDP